MSRVARIALFVLSLAVLASCGGGGGGGGGHNTTPASTTPPSKTGGNTPSPSENFALITVGSGVADYGNILTVTVTVCVPGTQECSTVPNVQVDTGSTGLRLVSSVLNANANVAGFSDLLPAVAATGGQEAECAQFADGVVWGSVRTASVTVGGLTTDVGTPIQVIADTAVGTTPPAACSNLGTVQDTSADLGANGIIGVGYFQQDCGPSCVTSSAGGYYFGCTTALVCSPSLATLAMQLPNTVGNFPAKYNNGDIIELPAVSSAGAPSASGNIVFGVNSFSDNQLDGNIPISVDPTFGTFSVNFNGSNLTDSFIDSGSSVYFFNDTAIPQCQGALAGFGYYCPTSPFTGSGTITGVAPFTNSVPFTFTIVNALTGVSGSAFAFNDLGAVATPSAQAAVGSGFDIGLPYFFGHSVYTVFEGTSVPEIGPGPFAAIGG